MITRFLMILVGAIVAVLLLKAVAAVALLAAIGFGCLFAFNVTRRAILGSGGRRRVGAGRYGNSVPQPMRRVAPLARPNVSVRR